MFSTLAQHIPTVRAADEFDSDAMLMLAQASSDVSQEALQIAEGYANLDRVASAITQGADDSLLRFADQDNMLHTLLGLGSTQELLDTNRENIVVAIENLTTENGENEGGEGTDPQPRKKKTVFRAVAAATALTASLALGYAVLRIMKSKAYKAQAATATVKPSKVKTEEPKPTPKTPVEPESTKPEEKPEPKEQEPTRDLVRNLPSLENIKKLHGAMDELTEELKVAEAIADGYKADSKGATGVRAEEVTEKWIRDMNTSTENLKVKFRLVRDLATSHSGEERSVVVGAEYQAALKAYIKRIETVSSESAKCTKVAAKLTRKVVSSAGVQYGKSPKVQSLIRAQNDTRQLVATGTKAITDANSEG